MVKTITIICIDLNRYMANLVLDLSQTKDSYTIHSINRKEWEKECR